ncbi:hypothetical protein BMS3Bbin15_00008 [archaeon BMS3Bbin15]|nr:hypothetical protein BMS3Bbin15_00008 [archaeon BMS3Bbin15]
MFYNSLSDFDDEIIYFTSEYVDLLEMIITKMKNNYFKINTSQREVFFKVVEKFNVDINRTDEQNIDIFTVLASVPFKETLTGGNTEYWNKWIDERRSKAYNQLMEELRDIKKEADEAGLLPDTDELLEEIKSMHTEKSLRELLQC